MKPCGWFPGYRRTGQPPSKPRWRRALPWILSVALGMLLGSSVFVLAYAGGLSYFSNDPAARANCHIAEVTATL